MMTFSLRPSSGSLLPLMAAALHDIGKMEICEDLLHKEGPLTEAERRTLQSHTLLGAQMLEEQPECRDDAFARTAYNICRWHQSRGRAMP